MTKRNNLHPGERFRKIPEYPQILVSNYGRVFNAESKKWVRICWRRGAVSEKIGPKVSIPDKSLKYFKKTVNLKPLVKRIWPNTNVDWELLK